MEYIIQNWEQILTGVASIVGGFSVLATMTPNKSDNQVVDTINESDQSLGCKRRKK